MRSRTQNRRGGIQPEIELSMTPMIDVVFQLLIYFLVTFSTADVLAHLDVWRPAPDATQKTQTSKSDMIRVVVTPAGYTLNGRKMERKELKAMLQRLAQVSTKQMVLVVCDDAALHGKLIAVLDMCAADGLTQISVLSGATRE